MAKLPKSIPTFRKFSRQCAHYAFHVCSQTAQPLLNEGFCLDTQAIPMRFFACKGVQAVTIGSGGLLTDGRDVSLTMDHEK